MFDWDCMVPSLSYLELLISLRVVSCCLEEGVPGEVSVISCVSKYKLIFLMVAEAHCLECS
jgi:hypothetical protein